MVAPTSPLRGILKTVSDNTLIVPSAEAAPKTGVGSILDKINQGATGVFREAQRKVIGTASATPGTLVTQNFRQLHAFMNGTPARFDTTLEQIRKIRDQLARLGPEVGLQQPLGGLKDPSVTDLVTGLKQESATVPPTVAPLIEEIADNARGSIRGSAGSQLESLYQKVVAECHLRLDGRYPFADSATDMSLRDFADVFGPGGIYDKFFTDNLESLVEKSPRWSWRDGAVNVSASLLPQFERADRIRQMFFNAGAKNPEVLVTLRLSKVDKSTSRFVFTIADQSFEARPGSDSQAPAVWPGADRREQATYAFEDRVAAPEKRTYTGPWAFLRLVDSVRLPPADAREVTDLSTVLQLSTKYHSAQVIIDAPNAASNPFGDREWRQFVCKP
jgi:type VI secretion system protein ImpL